jgi:hypothetical protein
MTRPANQRRRRGSVYIFIVGVTMLAAAITVAAALAGRVRARMLDGANSASDARSYAQSAIDLGRLYIAQDTNWRTDRSNGTWFTGMSIGSGSMQLDVLNPAGALNRFNADPIVFTGTGSCGTSVQRMQVAITPTIKPYSCLSTAMMSGSGIQFQSSAIYPSGVLVASNGTMNLGSSYVWPNLSAVGSINVSAGYCAGTMVTGAPTRTMPGSSVFSYYTANGTTISLTSLPFANGNRSLSTGVLAPSVNTIGGGTNTNGIYVIDCQNQQFQVSNARICATVILLNCGGLTIRNSVHWMPAISTLPCLMVQGSITNFKMDTSTALSELSLLTNLNPSGAPYPWPTGSTNILPTDTYPSTIRGLIYATGSVTFADDANIGMLIAGGNINAGGNNITLTYTSDYANNPPPGFYDVDMIPSSMTYTQITN